MDFTYSAEEKAFQQKVRDWLAENMKELPEWWDRPDIAAPEPDSDENHQFSLWWHRKLYDAGFVGITWPKEYGGQGAGLMEDVIFNEEIIKHRAPGPSNMMGTSWVGPSLMGYGTEEQRKRFLPKILSAEEWWCTLYSEPEAGSDMANVQTRAVADGDDYIVNGQKVWTSGGQFAHWGVLLVRTDPDASKHRGISYLFVDMRSPGITVRPLKQITGHSEFNEVFFDDVRIPKHQIIGEENKGWYVAVGALEQERTGVLSALAREDAILDLIKVAQGIKRNGRLVSEDPLIRQKLAQFYIEINVLKYIGWRLLTRPLRGESLGPESSVSSIFGLEFNQRLQEFAMQVQGPYNQLMRGSKYAIEHGRWQYNFLRSRANTIESGTSEIKRNVIAQRLLGLPR